MNLNLNIEPASRFKNDYCKINPTSLSKDMANGFNVQKNQFHIIS